MSNFKAIRIEREGAALLIPAHLRQKQADLCEFEACLVYRVSSRTARATQRNPVSKKPTLPPKKKKKKNKSKKKKKKKKTNNNKKKERKGERKERKGERKKERKEERKKERKDLINWEGGHWMTVQPCN